MALKQPHGFEATTTVVDWKSYRSKRVVRSSLAGDTEAYVENDGHVGIHQSVFMPTNIGWFRSNDDHG